MTTPRLPKRGERVLSRDTEEGVVLLDLDGGEYFTMNDVGARVWELCDGSRTVDDIVALVSQEYDVSAATVAADVESLLAELAAERLVL